MHPLFRVTSQSSFFPRKKASTFVLTFEKLAWKGFFLPSECFSCERIYRFPIEML